MALHFGETILTIKMVYQVRFFLKNCVSFPKLKQKSIVEIKISCNVSELICRQSHKQYINQLVMLEDIKQLIFVLII